VCLKVLSPNPPAIFGGGADASRNNNGETCNELSAAPYQIQYHYCTAGTQACEQGTFWNNDIQQFVCYEIPRDRVSRN
jgi:hypothetical protein